MASNDSDDLSGLNSPCSSAFLAPKCFLEPFLRKKEGRKEGQNGLVDLRARTSPQVKMKGKNSISGRENELSGLIRKTWEGLHDKAVAQIC